MLGHGLQDRTLIRLIQIDEVTYLGPLTGPDTFNVMVLCYPLVAAGRKGHRDLHLGTSERSCTGHSVHHTGRAPGASQGDGLLSPLLLPVVGLVRSVGSPTLLGMKPSAVRPILYPSFRHQSRCLYCLHHLSLRK